MHKKLQSLAVQNAQVASKRNKIFLIKFCVFMTLLRLTTDANVQLLESSSLPVGVLKGTDKMSFVSDTETYSLKVVVTSNSLLLVNEDGQSLLFKEYWELSQIPAQLTELQGLLEAVPFKGRDEEKRSLDNYV